jgi:hypothetical protein
MADYMHRTRLGSLKAALAWGKTGPDRWEVEGRVIRRLSAGRYAVGGRGVPNASGIPRTGSVAHSLTEAFEIVARAVEVGGRR